VSLDFNTPLTSKVLGWEELELTNCLLLKEFVSIILPWLLQMWPFHKKCFIITKFPMLNFQNTSCITEDYPVKETQSSKIMKLSTKSIKQMESWNFSTKETSLLQNNQTGETLSFTKWATQWESYIKPKTVKLLAWFKEYLEMQTVLDLLLPIYSHLTLEFWQSDLQLTCAFLGV